MASVNFVRYASTVHSYTGGASGHEGAYGIDENFSTYHGDEYSLGGGSWGGSGSETIISSHTFSKPRNLTSIKYRIYAYVAMGGVSGNVEYTMYVRYKSGGSWTNIFYQSESGGAGTVFDVNTGEVTYSTPVSNVTDIEAYCYVFSHTDEGAVYGKAYIYEIEAFGDSYEDIGIRYRSGSTTYKIAAEELLATHKLRIRKGSTTYGIPLVATGDANASPIRIYDGSATYALAKYTS